MTVSYETKRKIFSVVAILSTLISVSSLFMVHFWYEVSKHPGNYIKTTFTVDNFETFGFGGGGRGTAQYTIATGRIGARKENLESWRDYLKPGQKETDLVGQPLPVMFNSTASDMGYFGRSLRVLSMKDFQRARRHLFEAAARAGISPILWIAFLIWRKQTRTAVHCATIQIPRPKKNRSASWTGNMPAHNPRPHRNPRKRGRYSRRK